MRNMVAVSAEEFQTFLASYPRPLEQKRAGQAVQYLDAHDGATWPESIVASFLPATDARRRATGWRVAVPEAEEAE